MKRKKVFFAKQSSFVGIERIQRVNIVFNLFETRERNFKMRLPVDNKKEENSRLSTFRFSP